MCEFQFLWCWTGSWLYPRTAEIHRLSVNPSSQLQFCKIIPTFPFPSYAKQNKSHNEPSYQWKLTISSCHWSFPIVVLVKKHHHIKACSIINLTTKGSNHFPKHSDIMISVRSKTKKKYFVIECKSVENIKFWKPIANSCLLYSGTSQFPNNCHAFSSWCYCTSITLRISVQPIFLDQGKLLSFVKYLLFFFQTLCGGEGAMERKWSRARPQFQSDFTVQRPIFKQ